MLLADMRIRVHLFNNEENSRNTFPLCNLASEQNLLKTIYYTMGLNDLLQLNSFSLKSDLVAYFNCLVSFIYAIALHYCIKVFK